jgi:hypothetical protein
MSQVLSQDVASPNLHLQAMDKIICVPFYNEQPLVRQNLQIPLQCAVADGWDGIIKRPPVAVIKLAEGEKTLEVISAAIKA